MSAVDRERAALPAPMTSIVGREREIDQLGNLVRRDGIRLVTLTGTAGAGKTRLATEVAARCRDEFGGRVAFVSLETLSETSALLGAIASALGVIDSVDPVAGLRHLFRESAWLLVLDNLEQLPDAGPELAGLLKSSANLSIMATSRTLIGVYGECVFPVDPLPVPEPSEPTSRLAANPAVQLLRVRSRLANATFELHTSDLPLLAQIARKVDGLPLALELAGAFIPLLGVRGVLKGLDDEFRILAGGANDLPPRLQSMRSAIDWSYELLSNEEQTLFRRLGVFTGGFTFEMAEAMERGWSLDDGYPFLMGLPVSNPWMLIGKEGVDLERGGWTPQVLPPIGIDPLAGMESLAHQNLVRLVRTENGSHRYELLTTIREYGLEQLDRRGEIEAARHAHAVAVTSIAEICGWMMWSSDWRPAVDWITEELPNIRAASAWLASQPADANQIRLRLLEALWPFWQSRGFANEGASLLEAALASPGGSPGIRAEALNVLGVLRWIRNDLDGAEAALDEAFPIFQELHFSVGLGRNLLFRALIAWSRNTFDRAEKMALIARKEFGEGGDDVGLAMSGLILGVVARQRQDRALAVEWFETAYRDCLNAVDGGFLWGMGMAQYFLAEIARAEDDRVRAVTYFRAALVPLVEIGDPWTVGGCAGALAGYLVADGDLEDAARLLGATEALESSRGILLPPTERVAHETAARELRERIGPDKFAALFAEGQNWSMETAVARAMRVPMESMAAQSARQSLLKLEPVAVELPEFYSRTLQLRASGLNVKEIAQLDGVTQSSIYQRFDRIKELLGMEPHTSHAEVLVHAVRLGIV